MGSKQKVGVWTSIGFYSNEKIETTTTIITRQVQRVII